MKKGNYTVKKLSTKVKGHGYLKKTKLGLVSGIILASSLFVSLGSNKFVLAEETNTNSTEKVAPNGKTEVKDEFVREETVTVKEAALKAKVEEVKTVGVTVEEKPAEAVGVAKTETEEASLKKEAETKVDEQIKALEEAKKEELARQEKGKEINSIRKYYASNNIMKHFLVHHLNSREFDEDFNKTVELSDFKSDKGDVHFVEAKRAILKNPKSFVNNPITTVPTKVKTILYKNNVDLTPLQDERLNHLIDSYILKVKDGETISYNVKVNDESNLRKTYGIDTIEVKRTYNFGLANNPEYFNVITDKMIESIYVFSKDSKSTNQKEGSSNVITEYSYKDSTGALIPLKDLYAKVINISVFNGQEIIKSSDIRDENINAAELVRVQNDTSNVQFNSSEVKVTPEGRISQKFNYTIKDNIGGFIKNTFFTRKDVLKNVDYKKLMEPVSANYHLVTYKKLIDTGVVQQKFVDEKGNEIAPTITSKKSDKGSTVTVTTPPNEITYKGQTYLLQKENIPSSLVIEKGINSVTFSYKLQVVTDKGIPERLESLEFNGGVVPNEAPKLEVPENNEQVSMKGDPLTLEVPEYSSKKGEPLVQPELPAFDLNNEQQASDVETPKPQQKEQTKKSTFDETSKKTENEVQTSSEKPLPAKQKKEVVHQTESEKVVSNKQILPNTGMSDTSLYYTISASIMSLLGMMSLKFKKKDMK